MLHNAFEGLMTDRTGRSIFNAVNFARDAADRMRVIVDNTLSTAHYMNNSSSVTYRLWFDPNAVNTMDQREIERQASLRGGEASRKRWTYS